MEIQVKNISKIYGTEKNKVVALHHVSMNIQEGDFLSIMGPSGSGKSTLLHILSGLDRPTSGTVLYDQTQLAIRIKASDKNLAKLDTSQINASVDLNGMGVGDYEVPVKITLPDGYELVDSVKTTIHIKEKAVANKTTGTN